MLTAGEGTGCPLTETPARVSGASPWLKTATMSDARPDSLRTMVAFSMRSDPTMVCVPLPEFIEFCIVVLAPNPFQHPASRGLMATTVAMASMLRVKCAAITRFRVAGALPGTRGGTPDARDILMDLERGPTL